MGNLDMYTKYASPPKDALKAFNNGRFSGTDINPMWRIKTLTEEYGECGFGWYTEIKRSWQEQSPDTSEIMVFCEVALYVKRGDNWSRPIIGVGGNTFVAATKRGLQASDEAYKMAYTDALGIACKALGIGANVWWEQSDSKYTARAEANGELTCDQCKNSIQPTKTRTAQQVATATKERYGRILCAACARKEQRELDAIAAEAMHDDADDRS